MEEQEKKNLVVEAYIRWDTKSKLSDYNWNASHGFYKMLLCSQSNNSSSWSIDFICELNRPSCSSNHGRELTSKQLDIQLIHGREKPNMSQFFKDV